MTTTDINSLLDYDPNCKKCRDGWVEVFSCECSDKEMYKASTRCECYFRRMRERKVKRISETYPMPTRLKQKSFADFVAETETQGKALEKMSRGEPCYLFGPYGTGKTHLLAATVNMKLRAKVSAMFVSAPWLFEELRRDMFRDNNTERKVIDDACSVEYLAIDDLGKEKPTPMVEEKLFMIIDRRLNKNLLTSFSSNLPLDDQGNRIDGAIKSRIHEICDVLCVKGRDYRYAS